MGFMSLFPAKDREGAVCVKHMPGGFSSETIKHSKDKDNVSYGETGKDRICEGFVKASLDELECSYEAGECWTCVH